jgi:hypothetical protein
MNSYKAHCDTQSHSEHLSSYRFGWEFTKSIVMCNISTMISNETVYKREMKGDQWENTRRIKVKWKENGLYRIEIRSVCVQAE